MAGCGSHFELRQVAPERTVQGHVLVPDQGKLGELRTGTAIAFPSPARGFLATEAETLRRTDDGGRTWRTLAVGFHFVSLSFVSTRVGFGLTASGTVFATRDAGRSWRALHELGASRLTSTIQFVDASHGWVSRTGGSVYGTSDAGRSWSPLTLPCRDSSIAVSFVDDSSGFLVCGGGAGAGSQGKDFYATADGGRTWKRRACTFEPSCRSSLPDTGYVGRLDFRNAKTGLLATDRGGIWRTLDGGRDWDQTLLTDDSWSVVSTSWASKTTVFALTWRDGSLIRSDDAGAHWHRVWPAGPGLPVGALSFSSPRRGIGLGSNRILVPDGVSATTDGGGTWRHVADLQNVRESQLVRVGSRLIWTVGFQSLKNGELRFFLFRSTDGGRHWQRRPLPQALSTGATVSFPESRTGFAAGSGGLFRTDDGGGSWRRVPTRRRDLLGAVFVSRKEGLLVGDSGLFRSGDGGRTWRAVLVRPAVPLLGVFVLDSRHWWLEGRGTLLRTADGGRTWTAIRLRGLELSTVDFATPHVGYARTADGGAIERTTDGGRTWGFVRPR